jgi:hypothetical protein
MFFSNLEMKIQKWTFIFVHFSKIQNRFEKTLHHSFSQLLLYISPKFQYIYLSFYKFLQVFTRVFSLFMIPKRQNHTLPNLMAAAPCEGCLNDSDINNLLRSISIMVWCLRC